jgi:hypothetical protein
MSRRICHCPPLIITSLNLVFNAITYNQIVSLDRLKILIEKKFKFNNKHHIDFFHL